MTASTFFGKDLDIFGSFRTRINNKREVSVARQAKLSRLLLEAQGRQNVILFGGPKKTRIHTMQIVFKHEQLPNLKLLHFSNILKFVSASLHVG